MRNAIAVIEYGSGAWWDLVRAVQLASEAERNVSISIDRNGHGDIMTAVKVGEDVWSAHRKVTA